MHHRHQRQRAADLVPLQVADQMPADRQIGQFGGLLPKLLRPAFAEIAAAGLDQQTHHVGRHVLRHRHQRDRVGRPTASTGGVGDSPANRGNVLGDSRASSVIRLPSSNRSQCRGTEEVVGDDPRRKLLPSATSVPFLFHDRHVRGIGKQDARRMLPGEPGQLVGSVDRNHVQFLDHRGVEPAQQIDLASDPRRGPTARRAGRRRAASWRRAAGPPRATIRPPDAAWPDRAGPTTRNRRQSRRPSFDEILGDVQRSAEVLPRLLAGTAFDGGHNEIGLPLDRPIPGGMIPIVSPLPHGIAQAGQNVQDLFAGGRNELHGEGDAQEPGDVIDVGHQFAAAGGLAVEGSQPPETAGESWCRKTSDR